jgi:NAD(P)H dehydrogenase (quinone)
MFSRRDLMKDGLVLISGATGSTGRVTVKLLRDRGVSVRAIVHSEDDRSERLRALGAEIVVADLLKLNDVRAATQGVSAVYFCYPVRPGLVQASAFFAQAMLEAGVSTIVNMSQISARSDSDSVSALDHWVSERIFDRAGVPVVHLRPTFFSQWLLYPWLRQPIIEEGVIRLPYGLARHAPIAAEDQGRVIAEILVDPSRHVGQTYQLFGPEELNYHQIAEKIGAVLGRTISYLPIDIDEYAFRLKSYPLVPHTIQHFCAIAVDYQNGIFAGRNSVVQEITGTPPMSVEQFVTLHLDAFTAQPA